MKWIVCIVLITATAGRATADETVVPQRFNVARYAESFARNPFLVPPHGPGPSHELRIEDEWKLTGIVDRGGSKTVLLQNLKTGENKRVTATADHEGWKLLSATPARDRASASAEVTDGKRKGIVKFQDSAAPVKPQPAGPVNGMRPDPAGGPIHRRALISPRS